LLLAFSSNDFNILANCSAVLLAISSVSKKTVGSLDDVVNIKVYFSKNLPSQYITLPQEVGDVLDEYQNYSGGKVQVEFIDPKDSPEEEASLAGKGIPQLQFTVLENDKYQVARGYLGILVQYGDRSEVIPVVENTQNLEYQMTLAIKKATSDKIATIGFLTSNGVTAADEIATAYKKIQEVYTVQQVDLSESGAVPENIDTLVIPGATEEFSEEELKEIDGFVARGGSLLVLQDGVEIGEGLAASVNNTGLEGLLESYGLKLNKDLAADVSSGMASFTQGFITFSTNYPYWPKVMPGGFNPDVAAVAKLESLMLPWASTVDILSDGKTGVNFQYLAKTTDKAWEQKAPFDVNPQKATAPTGERKSAILAAMADGEIVSKYDAGKKAQARVVLVGDSDFLKEGFLRQSPDNLVFFQNLVDALSLDDDLTNIRSKGVSDRPLKELSPSAKAAIRYGNIFSITVLVIAFGMIRYWARKRSRFIDIRFTFGS